jgi:hypothetical protein
MLFLLCIFSKYQGIVARKEQNLQINRNKLIQFVNTNGGPVNSKSSTLYNETFQKD